MSLADRPWMRDEPPRRPIRLKRPPAAAIEHEPRAIIPPERPYAPQWLHLQPLPARRRLRRLAGLAAALTGIFTLAWAVGCAIVGASLHSDAGTFVPPAPSERS